MSAEPSFLCAFLSSVQHVLLFCATLPDNQMACYCIDAHRCFNRISCIYQHLIHFYQSHRTMCRCSIRRYRLLSSRLRAPPGRILSRRDVESNLYHTAGCGQTLAQYANKDVTNKLGKGTGTQRCLSPSCQTCCGTITT